MKKSSQCKVLAHLLTKSHISISASSDSRRTEQINLSSHLSSSLLSARVRVCPKFEIPKPVKLGSRPEEEVYKDIAVQTIEKIVQEKAYLKPILRLPKIELFPTNNEIINETKMRLIIGSIWLRKAL